MKSLWIPCEQVPRRETNKLLTDLLRYLFMAVMEHNLEAFQIALEPKPDREVHQERYSFAVFCGRHEIPSLDSVDGVLIQAFA